MKKVALVLAVLLFAVPAWAGMTVSIEQTVHEANEIYVKYDVDNGDANLPRAFALEIVVDGNNPVLSAPFDIHSEFYVYPGSIQISGGVVTSFGTPVAVSGSNTVTLEMGSLYASNDPCHTSPPPENGTLCKFTIDTDEEDLDCTVSVSIAGNAARGNVVMEDPDITYNNPSYVTYTGFADMEICISAEVCPTCPGDSDADGDIDSDDYYAIQGNLMYANYLTGSYLITPDHANPTVAGLWNVCEDRDVDGDVDSDDYYTVQGNLMYCNYLDGVYWYLCGDPRFLP